MTAPREEISRKVRQWMAHADEDLRLAHHALSIPDDCPYRLVAFHAQQCVEKCLKAYLVHREVDFPYTHNISYLLTLCGDFGPWAAQLDEAEGLSRYATTVRYPGEDIEVTAEHAEDSVGIARHVQDAVREALAAEGVDP